MSKRILLGATLAASLLAVAGSAVAEPERTGPADISKDDGGFLYDFRDADKLTAGGNGAVGSVIRLRSAVMRRTLIRPRANFVPELLKSVEKI